MKARIFLALPMCVLLLTGILSANVNAEGINEVSVRSVVFEDGTILTTIDAHNGNVESTYYTVNRNDAYRRYDSDKGYIINVCCKDAAVFENGISGKYSFYMLDDGSYAIGIDENSRFYYSGLAYDDVSAMVTEFLASENIVSVAVQKGYQRLDGQFLEMTQIIDVYSEAEITADDFKWAEDQGYSISSIEETEYGYYEVTMSFPDDIEYWNGIYTFMLNCMDMQDVYAVKNSIIEKSIWVAPQYETVEMYTNTLTGDADSSGTVDLDDAVLILQHYANTAAGISPASADTDLMDVNGSGTVDLDDAVEVLTIYAETAAGLR